MGTRHLFVGRAHELGDVSAAFDDALAGRGSLFLLVGVAGIGKTRLADELGERARSRGLIPYWGRCWETGGAPVYWPWIQILRELARDQPGAGLLAAAGRDAAAVAHLVPELGVPAVAAAAEPDPAQARFRLFDAVTSLLKGASRTRPLYLVLDDLHVSDPSSLALLHFVARNLRGMRALIVGTYRPEEAQLEAEVWRVLGDVAREGTYLPLVPLGRGEISEMVARFSGRAAEPALVDAIARTTEGNPLFVDELLRLLHQRGDLGAGGGATLPVPETIREVIRRRAGRLPAETRELLGVASVIGRDVSVATLAALARCPAAAAQALLAPAEAAGAIAATEPGSFRFSHVLVRETLYHDLPAERRPALHLALATVLAARGGDALAEEAHHRLAALPAGDPEAAAAVAQRAAERAMAMLAFEDAAALLEATRGALEGAGRLDAGRSFELRLLAGLAFMRAGQGERGRALCGAAAAEARALRDGERLARAALGYGAELMLAQNDRTLIELLTEALATLPPGPSGTRAQVMARLASAEMPSMEADPPMQMARDAIAMARAVGAGDDVVRAVLYFAGSALADYGEPVERAAISEELTRRARAAGDKVQVLRAECRLVFDYLEAGDVEKSQRAAEAYAAVAAEFRQSRHLWPVPLMRAMYATVQGHAAEAARQLGEARAIAAGDPEPITAAIIAWHAAGQVIAFERTEEVEAVMAELEQRFMLPTHPKIARAWGDFARALLLGRFSDDPLEIDRQLGTLPWEVPFFSYEPSSMTYAAEAVARAGNTRLAAMLYPNLKPGAHRVGSSGRAGFVCAGPAERALALYAGTLGRLDEAIALLDRAVARNEQMGFRVLVGDARAWQAHYLAMRRGPGDAERAQACLSEAEHDARVYALPRLAARIAQVRAVLADAVASPPVSPSPSPGRSLPIPPPEPGPRFSLLREADYWTVSAGNVTARIRDTRGMQMLASLVEAPGREMHVLALMGADAEGGADAGDAGELLDAEAVAEYRARLAELEEELAEAESWSDPGRSSRARAEREALVGELSRGVGLGGRARRAGAAAERARVNVQRRIRGAIKKIGESLPELAAYLDRAVRTGTFCSYEPF
jgi:tetratricopeptide (TPR) repeat protein